MALLNWFGARAQWVLIIGVFLALFLPALSAFLRPALPFLVSLVLAMAIARLDLRVLLSRFTRPTALAQTLGIVFILFCATGAAFAALATVLPIPPEYVFLCLVLAASPPIASSANLCLLLNLNAQLALAVTVASMVLTPILGPLVFHLFWPIEIALPLTDLALRLATIISGGFALGLALKLIIGSTRITRNRRAFDGIAALTMVLFVIPLFDGVVDVASANPGRAFVVFAFSIVINLGINALTVLTSKPFTPLASAGAAGIFWGNRTVAIYLAVLPFDPYLSMFVAFYQFPMYATPLILSRIPLFKSIAPT